MMKAATLVKRPNSTNGATKVSITPARPKSEWSGAEQLLPTVLHVHERHDDAKERIDDALDKLGIHDACSWSPYMLPGASYTVKSSEMQLAECLSSAIWLLAVTAMP